MTLPDPRLNAIRGDLADVRLRGRVEAKSFVEGEPAVQAAGVANLHRRPAADAPVDTQILAGEGLRVFDRKDEWAWVQADGDGYVGYLRAGALGEAGIGPGPTHRVALLRTPLFPEPSIKAPPLDFLSFLSPVAALGERGRFVERAGGGWLFAEHLAPHDAVLGAPVEIAHRFLNAPYLWGGRSFYGVDCSGLVQLAFAAAGRALLRDSDQQEGCEALGARLPVDSAPERGDLIFWKGHVAIALDAASVLHATAAPLRVVVEPLAAVDARARADSPDGITAIRRPRD
jgi:cell wall-associated NlpC family hydrolase